jgi:hypothetical protein
MDFPATSNLIALPEPDKLKNLCKSIAVLDAIISPDWEYRYFSYNADWDEGEELASMRDGQGDEYQILFNRHGAIINGFAHESEMNGWLETDKGTIQKVWPGVLEDVPAEFHNFINTEPIPSVGTTFCIWRKHDMATWQTGKILFPQDDYGDGSEDLLFMLNNNPETYKSWAEEYYDENFESGGIPIDVVKYIYDGLPVSREVVLQINPGFKDFSQLKEELNQIRYPFSDL